MAGKTNEFIECGLKKGNKMKVLIVEDENYKAQQVKETIIESGQIVGENIEVAPGINEAIKKMVETKYQFLIVDMCIPEKFGEGIKEDGGLELIRIITSDRRIMVPVDIVVLTSHLDMIEKYNTDIQRESFNMIAYNSSSEEWKCRILERLRFISKYDNSPIPKRNYVYDVAIITAVPVERDAISALSTDWEKILLEGDSTIYYETEWKGNKIVTTSLPQMGMVAATAITAKIIFNFCPKYIIMSGIAAGIKGDYEFGDIIIPREVKDYCSGKYATPANGENDAKENPLNYFIPTATSISTDADIINKVSQDFSAILYDIHKEWPQHQNYKVPNIRTGYIASGDSVVQNAAVIDIMIKNHLRQADGLDMEAYGMYYAAMQAVAPKPIPICIKAISDFADKDKSDAHQAYAAYVSAKFTRFLVENLL